MSNSDGHQHIGDRYLDWDYYEAPKLTPAHKAARLGAFACEFETMPPHREPYEGWAETMAYLSRRRARALRGDPLEEWVPRWERVRRAQNGAVTASGEPVTPVTDTVPAGQDPGHPVT